ncbi:hypothetical protein ACFQX6_52010 [Streptosporangium lutulentum]
MTATKTPPTPPAVATLPGRRIQLGRFRDLTLVPVIVVLLIAGSFVDPVFLTTGNLTNVLQQQSALALVVLAEALILIAGKFDLSLESTVGMAPAVGVMLVIPVAAAGSASNCPGSWRSRSACWWAVWSAPSTAS